MPEALRTRFKMDCRGGSIRGARWKRKAKILLILIAKKRSLPLKMFLLLSVRKRHTLESPLLPTSENCKDSSTSWSASSPFTKAPVLTLLSTPPTLSKALDREMKTTVLFATTLSLASLLSPSKSPNQKNHI